ncbi:hypothetical protein U9M48_018883 [Paspalum notatum var. saurae]|uniref:Uncharacterized protein n=1 Tax=Paspalum notatum var. saurae TaxID=547442 RepID=A0AAQ3TAC7_PASNO
MGLGIAAPPYGLRRHCMWRRSRTPHLATLERVRVCGATDRGAAMCYSGSTSCGAAKRVTFAITFEKRGRSAKFVRYLHRKRAYTQTTCRYGVDCSHDDIDDLGASPSSATPTSRAPPSRGSRVSAPRQRALTFFEVPGMSGPIPSSLTTLTISRTGVPQLHELDLSFNALAGAIPPSLAAARNLTVLDLRRNRLSGAIPPLLFSGFVVHTSAGEPGVYLRALSHNNLSGGVPSRSCSWECRSWASPHCSSSTSATTSSAARSLRSSADSMPTASSTTSASAVLRLLPALPS